MPRGRRRAFADRPAAGQRGLPRAGRRVQPAAGRRRRRAVHRRPGPGPRLPGAPGAERRALRRRSVLGRWRAPVPHRRPRALERRRRAGIPRPPRPAGQAAWLPHRAGGNPGTPAGAAGGGPGGGGDPRRRGRQPVGRLLHRRCRRRGGSRAEPASARRATGRTAGIHGSGTVDAPGADAPWPERQAGYAGAAGAGLAAARARRAADRAATAHRRDLERSARPAAGRPARRFLRTRRAFPAGHPHRLAHPPGLRRRTAVARAVRGQRTGGLLRTGPRSPGRRTYRQPRRDPPHRPRAAGAAVLLAAAHVVPLATGAGQPGLQRRRPGAPERAAGRGALRGRATGPGAAPRDPAYHVPQRRRRAGTARTWRWRPAHGLAGLLRARPRQPPAAPADPRRQRGAPALRP